MSNETRSVEIQGIDVSVHNGSIDWTKVKAAGKEFVFVRLGWAGYDGGIQSNGGLDRNFANNVQGAINAGLNVGVYVYSYCKTAAAAEAAARETLELVRPYNLAYPIAFDIEDTSASGTRYDQMSKADNTAIVLAFLDTIAAGGHTAIWYTYKAFAEAYLNDNQLSAYDAWIAQYNTVNTYSGSYTIWQYAGGIPGFTGSVDGISGAVDLNVSYKDYAAGAAETPDPDPEPEPEPENPIPSPGPEDPDPGEEETGGFSLWKLVIRLLKWIWNLFSRN